jgi:alginate O-acetyltransferase complex protein AlgI
MARFAAKRHFNGRSSAVNPRQPLRFMARRRTVMQTTIRAELRMTDDFRPRSAALALVAAACAAFALDAWPAWLRMWALAASVFFTFKLLTWRRALVAGAAPSLGRSLGYLLAWPGMDADAFFGNGAHAASPTALEWSQAVFKMMLGVGLVVGAALFVIDELPSLAVWITLVGLVFFLHCGSFHLLSLAWRRAGVDAEPIMDRPFYAATLAEFWGRRWNRAFRQLADLYVYRPLLKPAGAKAAFVAVFLASGLVHEITITLPARGGYGGPTLYFLIQAGAALAARSKLGRMLGVDRETLARLYAALVIVGPLGLLAPAEFRNAVIAPMSAAIRQFFLT